VPAGTLPRSSERDAPITVVHRRRLSRKTLRLAEAVVWKTVPIRRRSEGTFLSASDEMSRPASYLTLVGRISEGAS